MLKTPRELEPASSKPRRPSGLWKLSLRPWNRKGAGRAPYESGQNIHFYSPYGARKWFVKTPIHWERERGQTGLRHQHCPMIYCHVLYACKYNMETQLIVKIAAKASRYPVRVKGKPPACNRNRLFWRIHLRNQQIRLDLQYLNNWDKM